MGLLMTAYDLSKHTPQITLYSLITYMEFKMYTYIYPYIHNKSGATYVAEVARILIVNIHLESSWLLMAQLWQ